MNVLVACEESQAVCKAFRAKGHEAFSCDILPCSGGHPEWHIQGDVLPLINGECAFRAQNGDDYLFPCKWDLIIAHPPCTFLTNTGNRWFDVLKYKEAAQLRWLNRCRAVVFFLLLYFADCPRVVVENPIGIMSSIFRKPDQIVHPYYFAESEDDENCERKATCFHLRGVEPLKYEIKYSPRVIEFKNGKGTDSPWHMNTMGLPKEERSRLRSKTFPGIAKAMAEQWG